MILRCLLTLTLLFAKSGLGSDIAAGIQACEINRRPALTESQLNSLRESLVDYLDFTEAQINTAFAQAHGNPLMGVWSLLESQNIHPHVILALLSHGNTDLPWLLADSHLIPHLQRLSNETPGSERWDYGLFIVGNSHLFGESIGKVLKTSLYSSHPPSIFSLPTAHSTGNNLNQGTGGLSNIWTATLNGINVVVKIQQRVGRNEYNLVLGDLEVAQNLQRFGGPTVHGLVRVQDENGIWRYGVAMDTVPGNDLLTLHWAHTGGAALPMQVTAQHLQSFDNLLQQVAQRGLFFGDIQPGDFMLTPNGHVVPLDLLLIPLAGASPTQVQTAHNRLQEIRGYLAAMVQAH